MKTIYFVLVFFILSTFLTFLAGCATTNHNYFQTGKPSGKGVKGLSGSISAAYAFEYEVTDELGSPPVINIHIPEKKEWAPWAPLFTLQGHGGVTEHIDVGLALGLGCISFNLRLFSKICLFDSLTGNGICDGHCTYGVLVQNCQISIGQVK